MELKAFSQADADTMLDILTNDLVKQTYMLPDYEKRENAFPLFHRLAELSRSDSHFVRGIFDGETLVGFLNDVQITEDSIELGYVIHPRYQNRGYATAALKNATVQLFSRGYRQVICGAFAENPASLRVMEKAGMTRLSKTEEIPYRGTVHRCVYYGITQIP